MEMPKLPRDIIVDVLSRLPVKSLMRFKCVCKPWRSLISNPQFAKMHLNRAIKDVNTNCQRVLLLTYPAQSLSCEAPDDYDAILVLDYPAVTPDALVGSCNGLTCLLANHDDFILWNPSTRDSRKLPKPGAFPDISLTYLSYGFGYDSSVDDYKVVRIAPPATSGGSVKAKVEVFTLKTNSWRRVQDIDPNIVSFGSGIFFNGALHWAQKREIGQDRLRVIVSFDLATEKFEEVVPLRPILDRNDWSSSFQSLIVFGGCLSVICDCCQHSLEVWVMREYGVEASWTKLVTISCDPEPLYEDWLLPVCFSKNDEILMDLDGRQLLIYDIKEEKHRNLTLRSDCVWDWFETIEYVESLVSPNSNDGTDHQHTAQPRITDED